MWKTLQVKLSSFFDQLVNETKGGEGARRRTQWFRAFIGLKED